MDRGQRLRWLVLLSTLAATVAAILWPEQDASVAPRHRSVPRTAKVNEPVSRATDEHQPDWIFNGENPFAQHGWIAPSLPPAQAETRAVAPIEIVVTPLPPPLPFKFLGQMADGAERIIYLGLGEQVLLARTGDVLEGSYKVVAVTQTQIEFELTGSGVRQALPLPAQEP